MPDSGDLDGEQALSDVAAWVGVPAPPPDERLAPIMFEHNGDTWTAQIGERLRKQRPRRGAQSALRP